VLTEPARTEETQMPSGDKPHGRARSPAAVEGISAVTLATHGMARSVRFYQALGFTIRYGGEDASFTSLHTGSCYLNLAARVGHRQPVWWGRVIFYVSDVNAFYDQAVAAGLAPQAPPQDAGWGERYFHLTDPDGHELSFAQPLAVGS
jgi:uncharacterized glyoxalase superfamily protein PhnB